jgi:hypothetical protein
MRERRVRVWRWQLSWWREETRWGDREVQRDTWLHLRRRIRGR